MKLISIMISAASAQLCSFKNKCGQESPCCSEFGYCGKSAEFCGGGCIGEASFGKNSCTPPPPCKSGMYGFGKNNMAKTKDYDGNFEQTDFTFNGYPLVNNKKLYLRMYKGENMGTRVSTTRYKLYGTYTARMKTSMGQGVISSFITMSDTKDEIDFEFVGSRLNKAEANFYSKGVKEHTNGNKLDVLGGDSYAQWHNYTIDWTPNEIIWLIDGVKLRTVKKGEVNFPNTPSRVQFGIWNGGDGPKGTREWAGGYVDWNLRDPKELGYYYATVDSLEIKCFDQNSYSQNTYSQGPQGTFPSSNDLEEGPAPMDMPQERFRDESTQSEDPKLE